MRPGVNDGLADGLSGRGGQGRYPQKKGIRFRHPGGYDAPMKADDTFSATSEARRTLRLAATATLATLDKDGAPFASMVTVATTPAGDPILLLSTLAVHTRNLARDPRASLLVVAPGGEQGDPLAGSRLTLTGSVAADDDPATRRRFLARHPEARGYADFGDFGFYRLVIAGAHLVAGFGRIVDLERRLLLADVDGAAALIAAEEEAIDHMNVDHGDTVRLYATRLLGLADGEWTVTGVDPDGLDMACDGKRARLEFAEAVETPTALRRTLADLAARASNNG